MIFSIAIDGPAGAGKSTIADLVAERLGILHLDTGAMYRALGLYALEHGISTTDEKALTEVCRHTLPQVRFEGGRQHTWMEGKDVSDQIRSQEVGKAASNVSAFAPVRAAMVKCQQEIAKAQSIIMDGRDIGTVVLPNATLKVFLTASPEERSRRRWQELQQKGQEVPYETTLNEVIARDKQDTERAVTPLRRAEDAFLLDSSHKSMEKVVEEILRMLRYQQGQRQLPAESIDGLLCFIRGILRFLFHTFLPVQYHHQERALLSAPYILVANHNKLMDPFEAAFPIIYMYHVRFMGKKELVQSAIGRWFFEKRMRMIPVDRHHTDMKAVRSSLNALKEGHALGIFPEGTRHMEGILEHMESGTAMLALRSKALILPCYIENPLSLFKTSHVYYGYPFSVRDIAEKGITTAACEEVNERIRQAIRKLAAHEDA